jgi:hypothetical protein
VVSNATAPVVDRSVAEGVVSTTGFCTAPGAAGTFHVVATVRASPSLTAQATVTVIAPTGTPNLVVDASRTYQTIEGMGASASVELWNNGELVPALNALAVDNGESPFRVVRDRMDWVTSESDIQLLHALDGPTLTRIFEAPLMAVIWATIGHLNSVGVTGREICLDFMGWTPTWIGGSGKYGVASYVTAVKEGELATTIASLVYYGRRAKNLDFTYVSPLNEPDLNGLERALVGPSQYGKIANALAAELDAMELTDVRLVAPDTILGPGSYVSAFQADTATWARMNHLSFHTYGGSA